MIPTTRLGEILLWPKCPCLSPDEVDRTIELVRAYREITPEERQDIANIKAWLGKKGARG